MSDLMIKKYPLIFLILLGIGIGLMTYFVGPALALAEGEMPPVEEPSPAEDPIPVNSELDEETLISTDEISPEGVIPLEEELLVEETPVAAEEVEETSIPTDEQLTNEVPVQEETPLVEERIEETGVPSEEQPTDEAPLLENTPLPADEESEPKETPVELEEVIIDGTEPDEEEEAKVEVIIEEKAPVEEETQLLSTTSPVEQEGQSSTSEENIIEETAEEALAAEEQSLGPDPYIDRFDGRYRFVPVGGCAAFGGVGPYCSESATPLQAAIDAANDGEVINVEAGTYHEQVQVLNISLTLRGWGNPIISAPGPLTPTGSVYSMIYANNANLNIDGFIIDASVADDGDAGTSNSIYAIYYYNSSGIIANNTVTSNAATDDKTSGVKIENTDNVERQVTVTNNTVVNYTESGVTAQGSGLTTTITHNHFNNTAAPAADSAAIHVEGSDGNTISGNIIEGSHDQGIEVKDSDNNSIAYNFITDAAQNGISLINSSGNVVILNVIYRVDDQADSTAIRIDHDSDRNTLLQNTLKFNSIAVLVLNGSDRTTLAENRISNNVMGVQVAADISQDEPLNSAIYWNILTGNTTDVVNLTSNTLYATLNWWGCSQGPPLCGSTAGLVVTSNPLPYNPDPDYDMVFSSRDNCPFVYNPNQRDADSNGIGDACEEPVKSHKIPAVFLEEEIKTFSYMLDDSWATELILTEIRDNLNEIELVKVFYAPDAAPEGTLISFKQDLEETLPKPLEDAVRYLGPAFTLSAANEKGIQLDKLEGEMELRWVLPEDFSIPPGYQFAVAHFETDTLFWITEKWDQIPVELDETSQSLLVQSRDLGTFVLVLVPVP